MKEKLAIVIPAYKSKYLAETLSALTRQTNKNFTCVIANDASPEDLEGLAEEFRSVLNFEYSQFSENFGGRSLPDQWRRSISLTKYEPWIWLLCDDDIPGPTCVEEFYKALDILDREKINVFRFSTLVVDDSRIPQGSRYDHPVRETGAAFISRKLEGLTRSSLSEYIFRRSAYVDHGFVDFPLGWHTDDAAWVAYSKQGGIYSSGNAVVEIRISEDSISGQVKNIENKFRASVEFIDWLLTSGYIDKQDLSHHTWLYTYYGIEGYYVDRLKQLTLVGFWKLWKIRIKCVGFWESLKIVKITKLFFVSRA